MLTKLERKDFNKFVDWAYSLALDITRSSYPTYTDGIKTKQDFVDIALKSYTDKNSEILLFSSEGNVLGWINYYFIPGDEYIGLEAFNIENNTKTALKEFENYCRSKYNGYTLYMGFAKANTEAVSFFKENRYKLLETSYPYVYHFTNYKPLNCSDKVIKINSDNYDLFEKLHKCVDGDTYWNTERILKNLENWHIYYYDDGTAQSAIYFTGGKVQEIFGVDFSSGFNPAAFLKLLEKCLIVCHEEGTLHLYYFSENNEVEILSNLGFSSIGEYNLYTLCLT